MGGGKTSEKSTLTTTAATTTTATTTATTTIIIILIMIIMILIAIMIMIIIVESGDKDKYHSQGDVSCQHPASEIVRRDFIGRKEHRIVVSGCQGRSGVKGRLIKQLSAI